MARRRAVVGGLALLIVAGSVWSLKHRAIPDSFVLPARLPLESVVRELASDLTPDRMPSGVRHGRIAPRRGRLATAGPREAVIAPPGTHLPLRVRVPRDALLTFSVGVEHAGSKDTSTAG
jgi:hypothetical protein